MSEQLLRDSVKIVLDIQEFDIQMIRLVRLKKEREHELERIRSLKSDLQQQVINKENEIIDLKKQIKLAEIEVAELVEKIKKLESQQNSVKKVEEFNALTHEISAVERDKNSKEQRLSDLYDKQAQEEDFLKNLKATSQSTKQSSEQLEAEIRENVKAINTEGSQLKSHRDALIKKADPELLAVYEKLLKNKKDRVIVPIENRCCSGCHILVTAQHENLVRKGEKLIFCEHCSRIHYWQDHLQEDDSEGSRKRRRAAKV